MDNRQERTERPMGTELPFHSLGFHLVVYVDLLGQTNELDKFRQLPTPGADHKAAREAVIATGVRVHSIRRELNNLGPAGRLALLGTARPRQSVAVQPVRRALEMTRAEDRWQTMNASLNGIKRVCSRAS
jgi:hypothetical protein